jgi:catechol 2,3-dioxygenase-like lactoylglutathione lyase family enzyme
MTIQRMDNVGIVVDDLEAAIAFFVELGMELEGKALVEGRWVAPSSSGSTASAARSR